MDVRKKVLKEALEMNCDSWEKQSQDRALDVYMRYTTLMGWIIDLIHKGERVCLITILEKEEIISYIKETFKGWTRVKIHIA